MPLSLAAKNLVLDALALQARWVSIHTADPGAAGTTGEATGGSPAYARKQISWNPAVAGVLNSNNQPVFNLPAGTYTHFALWSAVSGGTFYSSGQLTAPVTLSAQGTYTLTDGDLTNPDPGGGGGGEVVGTTMLAYVTGYDWYDNTPPGSSAIAYSSEWTPGTIHTVAGGTGTYNDPITVAVGHVITDGVSTPDWAPGTRFYMPYLRRYFIVEDQCGDGPTPQNGPCHQGYPAPATTWLDVWVGGQTNTDTQSNACMSAITGVHTVIKDPPSNYVVVAGDISANGGCTAQFGETPVTI